ncbi:MAG TPA: hypothetical protein DD979_12235 [Gammaproteobacteria bacterium]|nr:hypothetical protein [Gammaproteobacteria bacterium]
MYTRVATFSFKSNHLDEALAVTRETINPALEKIDGVRLMVVTIDRERAKGSATTIYESREKADQAQEVISHIWGVLEAHLLEPPDIREREVVFGSIDGALLVED